MTNPYPALDDQTFQAVADGEYTKSSYSNGNAGCVSFTVVDDLVGLQDDKLGSAERKARTLVFTRDEIRAFVLGAKNGEFDRLIS